jgi:dienelactone hydrolase
MPARPRRRLLLAALACGAVAISATAAWPHVRSLALLLDLGGRHDGVRRWLPVARAPVTQYDIELPTRHGPLPARVYAPDGRSMHTLAVFPGIHSGGIDEPRLVTFSERLAAAGYVVVSVPLPDLRAFRITTRSTDHIEDAIRAIAESAWSGRRSVGVVGVSFAGGLALVAAGRPSLDGRVTAVFSIGGHGDLPRTLQSLCGEDPLNAGVPVAHIYALGVVLRSVSPHVVPRDQVGRLEDASTAFLEAHALPPERGNPLLDELRDRGRGWPEPTVSLVRQMLDGDAASLCRAVAPHIEAVSGDPALSPERSPLPHVPIFLLHGEGDRVIPSTETPRLAAKLRARGHEDVHWLVTPAVVHVELEARLSWPALWRLVRFWTKMFDAL